MKKRILSVIIAVSLMVSALFTGSFFVSGTATENAAKSFHVLTLGNSFSRNSMYYLYDIARACGYTDIKIGYLYYGGCTLRSHWDWANQTEVDSSSEKTGEANYSYWENSDGTWKEINQLGTSTAAKSADIIGDTTKEWDYVMLQQASELAGIDKYNDGTATFEPYIDNLVKYVKKLAPNAKIGYNMVWSDQKDSVRLVNEENENGKNYYSYYVAKKYLNSEGVYDPLVMYNAIADMTKTHVAGKVDFVIPTGTAVQNLRTSYIGDNLTNEGYHLNDGVGQFVAGLTYFAKLSELDLNDYTSELETLALVHPAYNPNVIDAVTNAIKTPYSVTNSSFITAPEFGAVVTVDKDSMGYGRGGALVGSVFDKTFNRTSTNLLTKDNAVSIISANGTDTIETPNGTVMYNEPKSALEALTDGDKTSQVLRGAGESAKGLKLTYKLADTDKIARINRFAFAQGNVGYGIETSYKVYLADTVDNLYDSDNMVFEWDAAKDVKATNADEANAEGSTLAYGSWGQIVDFSYVLPEAKYLGVLFTDTCTWATANNTNVQFKEIGLFGEVKTPNTDIAVTPICESFTDTSVTLKTVTGYEYSKDGMNWQDSNVFEGLLQGTPYTFYQRIKATDTVFESKAASAVISTDKGTPAAPSAPELESKTENSVTLKHEAGYEYSMDGENWQTSSTFYALNETTKYSFYRRLAETTNQKASAASAPLVLALSEKTVTGTTENMNGVAESAFSSKFTEFNNNTAKWEDSLIYDKKPLDTSKDIIVGANPTDSVYKGLTNGTIDHVQNAFGVYLGISRGGYAIYDLGQTSSINRFAFVQRNPVYAQEASYEVYAGMANDDGIFDSSNLIFKHEAAAYISATDIDNTSFIQSIKFDSGKEPIARYIAVKVLKGNSNGTAANSYPREIGVWGNALSEQQAPEKPELVSKANGKITLKYTAGYEYTDGINGWQISNEFTFEAGKTYTFYQRKAATENALASEASAALTVETITGISGDANCDGKVNICDLVYVNEYLNKETASVSIDANLNEDNVVDEKDYALLKALLLK